MMIAVALVCSGDWSSGIRRGELPSGGVASTLRRGSAETAPALWLTQLRGGFPRGQKVDPNFISRIIAVSQ